MKGSSDFGGGGVVSSIYFAARLAWKVMHLPVDLSTKTGPSYKSCDALLCHFVFRCLRSRSSGEPIRIVPPEMVERRDEGATILLFDPPPLYRPVPEWGHWDELLSLPDVR